MFTKLIVKWLDVNGRHIPATRFFFHRDCENNASLDVWLTLSSGKVKKPKMLSLRYSSWNFPATEIRVYFENIRAPRITRVGERSERDVTGEPLALAFIELIWRKYLADRGKPICQP